MRRGYRRRARATQKANALAGTAKKASRAIATLSSGATRKLAGRDPIARPILHLAGRNDQVVSFDNQQRTIEALVRNAQASVGEPWAEVRGATLHRAKNGAHVATWFHDGGHELPDEGWRAVAAFLRRTPMPEAWTTESTIAPGLVQRTYASRAARTFVSYHVLVPAGYDHAENAERRYPVVMWLHGSGGGGSDSNGAARRTFPAMTASDLRHAWIVRRHRCRRHRRR